MKNNLTLYLQFYLLTKNKVTNNVTKKQQYTICMYMVIIHIFDTLSAHQEGSEMRKI